MSDSLLRPELIMLDLECASDVELITVMANGLLEQGYVKETYLDAILKRERDFSTGLPGNGYGVAIPHTDPEHVVKSAIAVGLLRKSVAFKMMGDPTQTVEVELCFMLCLKESHSHIEILQSLMVIIQDEELMNRIKNTASQSELYELLRANIE